MFPITTNENCISIHWNWISVEDRYPPDEEEVLVFDGDRICTATIWWHDDDGKPYFMCRGEFRVEPTHWMHLPPPPTTRIE